MTIQPDSPTAQTPSSERRRRQQVVVRRSSMAGAIAVAVDLEGRVVDLHLADTVLNRTANELAEEILGCVRAAQDAVR